MVTRTLPQQTIQTQLNISLDTFNCNRLKLSIQRVPRHLAIAPDRYFLTVDCGDDSHIFPIQMTREEACQMIEQAQWLRLPGGEG